MTKKAHAAPSNPSKNLKDKKNIKSPAPRHNPKAHKKTVLGNHETYSSLDHHCKEIACETPILVQDYCRLHYIKNWKKIKRKEQIFKEGTLIQYIEELVSKHPDKYIEAIRQDLAHQKDFLKVICDLDLDENMDDFDADTADTADGIIDSIKRDFDDESEVF